jgi:predicted nucleic acid-binding protein
MSVVIDTIIWSLALRRRSGSLNPHEQQVVRELATLVGAGRTILIGVIRQEVLSGIRQQSQFALLRNYLRDFADEPVSTADHERAAEHYNNCQSYGIQGSHIDFLICAVAERLGAPIFSLDVDFTRYARHLPITLHTVRAAPPL